MGVWIFMIIMSLVVPFIMICFGNYFVKNAPKEINRTFGYRSSMSMKNKDTWEFAHHYCGKLWRIMGWSVLIISIIVMLFAAGKGNGVVGIFGGILSVIQVIFLISSIFITERVLKRNFDRDGNRKNSM